MNFFLISTLMSNNYSKYLPNVNHDYTTPQCNKEFQNEIRQLQMTVIKSVDRAIRTQINGSYVVIRRLQLLDKIINK